MNISKTMSVVLLLIVIAAAIYFIIHPLLVQSSPIDPVKHFEMAYNNADINDMIDCFEPFQAKGMKSALKLLGSFIKISAEDILNIIPMIPITTDSDNRMPKISINIDTVEIIDKNTANVVVKVEYLPNKGSYNAEYYDGLFITVKVDGKWYIRHIK